MAKAVVREVKILDAVLKEDEGTEDEPKIEQYIWLQLLDVKSEKSFTNWGSGILTKSKWYYCRKCHF